MNIYANDDSVKPRSLNDASIVDMLPYRQILNRMMEIWPEKKSVKILDCFSGSGYGSYFLSQFFHGNILAIDGSGENTAHANKFFGSPKIINATKKFPFKLPLDSFDFIVSVESLEHLPVSMHEAFLSELAGSLTASGRLFLSSPSARYSDYEIDVFPSHFSHPDLISYCEASNYLELVQVWGLDYYRLENQPLTGLKMEFRALSAQDININSNQEGWSSLYEFRKK